MALRLGYKIHYWEKQALILETLHGKLKDLNTLNYRTVAVLLSFLFVYLFFLLVCITIPMISIQQQHIL